MFWIETKVDLIQFGFMRKNNLMLNIDGLVWDCMVTRSANALKFAQSCAKPSLFHGQQIVINGLVQECGNSTVNALELLQSCTKPLSSGVVVPKLDVYFTWTKHSHYIDGVVQDCSNSSALAMESLQSCIKPSTCPQNSIQNKYNNQCIYNISSDS